MKENHYFQVFFNLDCVMVELTGHQRLSFNLKVTTFNHSQLMSVSEHVPLEKKTVVLYLVTENNS